MVLGGLSAAWTGAQEGVPAAPTTEAAAPTTGLPDEYQPPTWNSTANGQGQNLGLLGLRAGASLICIVALILVCGWLLKRFYGQSLPTPGASKRAIRLVEALPLGPGRALYLVAIGPKVVLLGQSQNALNMLCELSPEETQALARSAKKAASTDAEKSERAPTEKTAAPPAEETTPGPVVSERFPSLRAVLAKAALGQQGGQEREG
jgi:flagellar biosynthetic protein FliO